MSEFPPDPSGPPPYGVPPGGGGYGGGPGYGQAPPYGQPPYGQPPYGQPPYGQPPYGQQPPYGGPSYYGQPPYPGPYGWAPKPGCIPLRPLTVGEILSGSFTAIFRNAKVVLTLSAVVAVIQGLLSLVIRSGGGPLTQLTGALIGAVLASVLTGALIIVVTEDVVGRRAGFDLVLRRVRARFWPLLGVSLVTGILEFLGLILLIAPGVWLWGIWAVAVPTVMIERAGVGTALDRSRQLVRGMFWRVWGIRALGYLISSAIAFGVGTVVGIIGFAIDPHHVSQLQIGGSADGSLSAAMAVILVVGGALGAFVSAPIRAGVDSLLYVDQRMRKENLANDLQQAAAMSAR